MKLLRKFKIYYLTGNYEDPKVKKIVEFFDEICNNLEEYYSDKYPKFIFYKYNDKLYFELDLKNNKTWCRYEDFWQKFETEFGLNNMEIKWLTQYMLGIHLKRKIPPTLQCVVKRHWSLGIHLKRKVPPTKFCILPQAVWLGMHLKRKIPPTYWVSSKIKNIKISNFQKIHKAS